MEQWKDIKGYEGRYQISSDGKVFSIISQRQLKPKERKDGYIEYTLTNRYGKIKYERAHRLVAINYIDNPNNYPVVNHKDENKSNNNVDNLEWCTVQYNTLYSIDRERLVTGVKSDIVYTQQVAITEAARIANTYTITVFKDGAQIGVYYGKEEAARALGIDAKTIYNCVRENRSTRSGFSFAIEKGGGG